MQTEKGPASSQTKFNDNLPTLYVDSVDIRTRRDGMNLLRFTANLPDGHFEQTRVFVDKPHLRTIIDGLCSSIDYYPEKASDIVKKRPSKAII